MREFLRLLLNELRTNTRLLEGDEYEKHLVYNSESLKKKRYFFLGKAVQLAMLNNVCPHFFSKELFHLVIHDDLADFDVNTSSIKSITKRHHLTEFLESEDSEVLNHMLTTCETFISTETLSHINPCNPAAKREVSYLYKKVDESAISKMARDVVRNVITPEVYIKLNLHGKGDLNKEGWTELHMFQVSYLYKKVDESAISKMARDVVRNVITPEVYIKLNLHGKGDLNKEGWTELHMFQVQRSVVSKKFGDSDLVMNQLKTTTGLFLVQEAGKFVKKQSLRWLLH
ncbi:unnamed protein product [Bemisia tabaci]|uniref:HECT domain-containing protein n=2 Tax=Bemisia tabaci TaxID=7038 RepID=A0A9P0CF76_BEMTA|nr:unnamed protein product [Bemisia tabaci]